MDQGFNFLVLGGNVYVMAITTKVVHPRRYTEVRKFIPILIWNAHSKYHPLHLEWPFQYY